MASFVPNEKFMRLALNDASRNIGKLEGGPFGACVVKNGKAIAVSHNTVLKSDATCHAEINAIRKASSKLGTFDLSGCEIYSTTEPCPMCFSAIHWARIKRIVYGTTVEDAAKLGFNELQIHAKAMKRIGKSKLKVDGGFLREECLELLGKWKKLKGRKTY